jgi:hypothetical protein
MTIVLKGQDVVVLLAAVVRDDEPEWAGPDVRSLAHGIGFDLAGTSRALRRLGDAGLFDAESRRVRKTIAAEFLQHALRFMYPLTLGEETRGLPTLWAAPPLRGRMRSDGPLPVWPDPLGTERGSAVEPLHRIAISAAKAHPRLYEGLVIADALRVSGARERAIGGELLGDWLRVSP